jgi:hypothetical protein
LERKYIQLLEEKIVRLEKTLVAENKPEDEKPDASDAAKQPDTADGSEIENSEADQEPKNQQEEKKMSTAMSRARESSFLTLGTTRRKVSVKACPHARAQPVSRFHMATKI